MFPSSAADGITEHNPMVSGTPTEDWITLSQSQTPHQKICCFSSQHISKRDRKCCETTNYPTKAKQSICTSIKSTGYALIKWRITSMLCSIKLGVMFLIPMVSMCISMKFKYPINWINVETLGKIIKRKHINVLPES